MAVLAPGLQLAGRYTLERRLGSGGMAEVWSAFDAERGERVALKVLDARLAAQPGMIELLRNEYRNVSRLRHPHIVRTLGLHDDAEQPFIVFELIEGGQALRLAGRPPAEFLPVLLQVVDALAHAHAAGIVHRDFKLTNVLLDGRGAAHVTDFGVAAVHSGDGLRLRTGGTPAAMSPQQLAREQPAPADDLYALGVVLDELTRAIPAGAAVPQDLERLISELLATDPAARPASMDEVTARLRGALAATVTTVPPELADLEDAAATRFEQVVPLSPRRGRAHDRVEAPRTDPWRLRLRYGIGGALFLLTAAIVFAYLPRTLPKPDEAPASVAQAPTPAPAPAPLEIPGPPPFELAKLARARDDAQELVDRIVDLQDQAEQRGALVWAGEEYSAATTRAQAGDDLFKKQDYEGARTAYEEAARAFETVLARADTVLADTVGAGWSAYAAHDAATAIDRFQLALKIDPAHTEAARGLRRAERLDEVTALMASAAAHDREGRTEEALAAWREASVLDPELTEPQEQIARITSQLGRAAFDATMSEGYAALERGDERAARAAFTRAQKLDPKSNAAADALAQIDNRVRTTQFESLKAQASAEEEAERWSAAADVYEQVLKSDPTLVFAQEGVARAREMAEVHRQLDAHLAAPVRLSSDGVYESAQALMQAAASLPGAELARKREKLGELLAVARTPMPVRLESDNATEVVVHQVDRLGRFTVRDLELRPGTYTAVGTRAGYRDVRREFTVVAGEMLAPVVIQCEERI